MLAMEFLSQLWGGRYCPLIPVDPKGDNDLARGWLRATYPDLVYAMGVDHGHWAAVCEDVCQPRRYVRLTRAGVSQLRQRNLQGLVFAESVVQKVLMDNPSMEKSNVVLVETSATSPHAPLVAALFGLHKGYDTKRLANALKADVRRIGRGLRTADRFLLCRDMAAKLSWLDLASYGLDSHVWSSFGMYAPTVVVVRNVVRDLSLLWNVRMELEPQENNCLMPIAAEEMGDPSSLDALADWIRQSHVNANYCQIISLSVGTSELDGLARRLRPKLRGSSIEHVDVEDIADRLPRVVGAESQEIIQAQWNDDLLSLELPRPSLADFVRTGQSWIVDLMGEAGSFRSLNELDLPRRPSVAEILNAPFPPTLTPYRTRRIGWDPDAIGLRCDSKTGVVTFRPPASREIIEGVLQEASIQPEPDEKRSCYETAVEVLGGLLPAADALTGRPLRVLTALCRKGPLTVDEIKGHAELGKDPVKSEAWFERYADDYGEYGGHVVRQRFRAYWAGRRLSDEALASLLDRWAGDSVVRRVWRLPQCEACGHLYNVPHIDITAPVLCRGCGTRLRLPVRVPLAYELNPMICTALKEGIESVVLTGRFLHGLTRSGFMWLPGVKFAWDGKRGDIDIAAICDGRLVVAECKSLRDVGGRSRTWADVSSQLERLHAVARQCKADVLVLASRGHRFSTKIKNQAKQIVKEGLPVLLLSAEDLARGRRKWPVKGKVTGSMSMDDVAPQVRKRRRRRRRRGERKVVF